MVKLEQFIIHRRKFVLEPYRRKGRKDPIFFYKGMIDINPEQIPSKFGQKYQTHIIMRKGLKNCST
jgi:hypothetical protein